MKLSKLILEDFGTVSSLAAKINDAIVSVDENLHYGVFAKAVAEVLESEYGSHNYQPFIDELSSALNQNNSVKEADITHEYKAKEDELAAEISKASGQQKVHVKLDSYSNQSRKREKGNGVVIFVTNDVVDPTAFKQVVNLLKAKGYKVTEEVNVYDDSTGKVIRPTIKFTFSI